MNIIQSDHVLTAPTCTGSLHTAWNITGVRVILYVFSAGIYDCSSITCLSEETGVLCSVLRTFLHLQSKDNRCIQHLLWVTLRFKVQQFFRTCSSCLQWLDYILRAINVGPAFSWAPSQCSSSTVSHAVTQGHTFNLATVALGTSNIPSSFEASTRKPWIRSMSSWFSSSSVNARIEQPVVLIKRNVIWDERIKSWLTYQLSLWLHKLEPLTDKI